MLRKDFAFEAIPVAVAAIFAIAAVIVTGPHSLGNSDSSDYLATAGQFMETGNYPASTDLPFYRPPLYPFLIMALWMMIPGSVAAIKPVQIILHAATAWLVFRTTRNLVGGNLMPMAAGLIFAANPFFFYLAATVQSEGLQVFLLVLAIFFAVKLARQQSVSIATAATVGGVLGLAALNKPSAFGIGLGVAAFFFVLKFREKSAIKASLPVFVAMLLVVLPWSIYNLAKKGEFFVINDSGGFNFWLGNHPESIGVFENTFATPAEAQAFGDYIGKTLVARQIAEWEASTGYSALTLTQREKLWSAKAWENIFAYPGVTARLLAWKFVGFWKPFISASSFSGLATIISALVMVPVFLAGAWGIKLVLSDASTSNVAFLFVVFAVLATVIHVAIVSSVRLRLPYIDPFLSIFAGIGVVDLGSRIVRTVRDGGSAAPIALAFG